VRSRAAAERERSLAEAAQLEKRRTQELSDRAVATSGSLSPRALLAKGGSSLASVSSRFVSASTPPISPGLTPRGISFAPSSPSPKTETMITPTSPRTLTGLFFGDL
jgi:hypothetical protein